MELDDDDDMNEIGSRDDEDEERFGELLFERMCIDCVGYMLVFRVCCCVSLWRIGLGFFVILVGDIEFRGIFIWLWIIVIFNCLFCIFWMKVDLWCFLFLLEEVEDV